MKHAFNIEVAERVGVNAAVVFESLSFWVLQNETAGRNIRDGVAWTYGSVREIADGYSYLSEKQVRGALEKLQAAGLIRTATYNKLKYDRTTWRTLTAEGERIAREGATESAAGLSDLPARSDGFASVGGPIPITKHRYKRQIVDKVKMHRINEALKFTPYA